MHMDIESFGQNRATSSAPFSAPCSSAAPLPNSLTAAGRLEASGIKVVLPTLLPRLVGLHCIDEGPRRVQCLEGVTTVSIAPQAAVQSATLAGEFQKSAADRMIVVLARDQSAATEMAEEKVPRLSHVRSVW
ncbi:MAG: hypothetical protein ABIR16_07045 [Dokdonella sp.]